MICSLSLPSMFILFSDICSLLLMLSCYFLPHVIWFPSDFEPFHQHTTDNSSESTAMLGAPLAMLGSQTRTWAISGLGGLALSRRWCWTHFQTSHRISAEFRHNICYAHGDWENGHEKGGSCIMWEISACTVSTHLNGTGFGQCDQSALPCCWPKTKKLVWLNDLFIPSSFCLQVTEKFLSLSLFNYLAAGEPILLPFISLVEDREFDD